MSVMASWSGGKDCCLATYRAMKQGHRVKALFNMTSKATGRCCFHGLRSGILELQADLIGIPLVQGTLSDDMQDYEKEFKTAVSEQIQTAGIEGMVFGDIYLDEHKDWVERVCSDMGITALEPLWQESTGKLIEEFVEIGFEAVIVSCKADVMGREFAGRKITKEMIGELEANGVCPCGENGEFHTLVVNGPIFKRQLEILDAEPVLKDGFWKHWALDIKSFR